MRPCSLTWLNKSEGGGGREREKIQAYALGKSGDNRQKTTLF